MENVVIFYDHLEYFTAIWYNLWPFGVIVVIWYIFSVLVCLDQEISGNPDPRPWVPRSQFYKSVSVLQKVNYKFENINFLANLHLIQEHCQTLSEKYVLKFLW
jgi:hypothetical protein